MYGNDSLYSYMITCNGYSSKVQLTIDACRAGRPEQRRGRERSPGPGLLRGLLHDFGRLGTPSRVEQWEGGAVDGGSTIL